MNTIKHNISAMNSQRVNNINMQAQSKTVEKLSSGFKVNRAADDAAGLSISEKMRKQIRGLTQASSNAQDGISMVQICDGALTEVHEMLQRGNELMVKAANGTLSNNDRDYINMEIQQLKTAIDQVATTTKFNEIYLFPDNGYSPLMASPGTLNKYSIEFGEGGITVTHTGSESDVELDDSVINTGNALAKKIAQEYVPNAVNQILTKFPSMKSVIDSYGDNSSKLKLELEIKTDDGEGNRLAYVTGHWTGANQDFQEFSLTIDKDDFSSSDVTGNNSAKLKELESTLAHELMHAVMDVALPKGMAPNSSADDFPGWFKEGTAQLAGGGFPTNWNYYLQRIDPDGATADTDIAAYLSRGLDYGGDPNEDYTVESRPYGHGYLAAAYLGYLASSGGSTIQDQVVNGMNTIFNQLKTNPDDFASAIQTATGSTVDVIISAINSGSTAGIGGKDSAVTFVKNLLKETGSNGAGSFIASGGLSATAQDILGTTETTAKIYIDLPEKITSEGGTSKGHAALTFLGSQSIGIHAGADADMTNKITVKMFNMSSKALGLEQVGLKKNEQTGIMERNLTEESATRAINSFATAIDLVSSVRSYYGAMQNRMEHTILNLNNVVENTASAESAIRDTDMATEAGKSANNNILIQAGQQMMAQANKSNEGILTLMK